MSGGSGITSVELVKRWVFADLSSGTFTDQDKRDVLEDVDDLEEDLVQWGRPLMKCVGHLEVNSPKTVYKRRDGDLRCYYIRRGDTLYCIGVGKRKKTYDRDLQRMVTRAEDFDERK